MTPDSVESFEIVAPGKLVLIGEYGVIDDASAIVLAINRGVRCTVSNGDGIVTPDGDTRFVAPALSGAPTAMYRFSHWNPVELPDKPGFGGSAAACVAACVAAGRTAQDAFSIHKDVQGGGSGIDVAASIHGGMILFNNGSCSKLPPICPSIIWSGQSAQTGPRVTAYRQWQNTKEKRAFVARSNDLAGRFVQDPINTIAHAHDLLVNMASLAQIEYLTDGLTRIVELARKHGGAAKPSGAGGGDCAIAMFPDTASRVKFEADCTTDGLMPVSAEVSHGVHRVEGT